MKHKKLIYALTTIACLVILYIPAMFLFNEIKLQLIAPGYKKQVEKYLVDKYNKEIISSKTNVGLVEEEIDVIVRFKDEPTKDYTFGVADGEVYQVLSLGCYIGCDNEGQKKYP